MKKSILLLLLFFIQYSFACNCLTFKEAQKKALLENKFILVYYSNSFETDDDGNGVFYLPSLSETENEISNKFIFLCITSFNVKQSKYKKYQLNELPTLLIVDAIGNELHRFINTDTTIDIYQVLKSFSTPSQTINKELKNYIDKPNYVSALRLSQKYFDYSMLINNQYKKDIFILSEYYINQAESFLSKKDENYFEKKQKIDLFKLYRYAFDMKFDILNERINEFDESSMIYENKNIYYFLKLLAAKAMKTDQVLNIEEKTKTFDGFDDYLEKMNLLLYKV